MKLEPDLAGYEFGQYCFEEFPKASSYTVNEVITSKVIEAHDADITEPRVGVPKPKHSEFQNSQLGLFTIVWEIFLSFQC